MKDIADLIAERKELIALRAKPIPNNESKDDTKDRKRRINLARKRNTFLAVCIMYLESHPTEEFINKEITRLKGLVSAVDSRFQIHLTNNKDQYKSLNDEKAAKKDFYKEYGVTKMKSQIKALNFLIK